MKTFQDRKMNDPWYLAMNLASYINDIVRKTSPSDLIGAKMTCGVPMHFLIGFDTNSPFETYTGHHYYSDHICVVRQITEPVTMPLIKEDSM